MNYTLFTATFLRNIINLRLAQHKRRHKSTTPIILLKFMFFLQKDLGDSQVFIDSILSKFKKDSQYQLEEAWDYTSYL